MHRVVKGTVHKLCGLWESLCLYQLCKPLAYTAPIWNSQRDCSGIKSNFTCRVGNLINRFCLFLLLFWRLHIFVRCVRASTNCTQKHSHSSSVQENNCPTQNNVNYSIHFNKITCCMQKNFPMRLLAFCCSLGISYQQKRSRQFYSPSHSLVWLATMFCCNIKSC